MKNLTGNKEDYLKIIYELGGQYKKVSNKDISKALGISPPSVSEMIRKLLKEGYVKHVSYQGVVLTQLGLEEATKIRRRHLLWEVFLVEKLGYDWEDVHEEAEKLEHITSDKLEKALDSYLNNPQFCPHGSPINKLGDQALEYTPIYDLEEGMQATIKRIKDSKEVLNLLKETNLKIGDPVELVQKDIKDRLFIVKSKGRNINLEFEYLMDIYVE